MNKLTICVLCALAILLAGCSEAPPDNVIYRILDSAVSEDFYTNEKIISKSRCQLSNNTEAEGVSERWVVNFSATKFTRNQIEVTEAITVQKRNGEWEYYIGGAMCD